MITAIISFQETLLHLGVTDIRGLKGWNPKYIDAEQLIEELTPDPVAEMGCPEPEWLGELIDILDNAESADVRPVIKGEWIIQSGEIVCSECFEPNLETNYCPHCGAKMWD